MIKALYLLSFFTLLFNQDVPYKASEEFEITIDYKFQERPVIERSSVKYDANAEELNRRANSGLLPYLKINLKLLKLNKDEVKVRVMDSEGKMMYNRKASEGNTLIIDIGYIDDVKDRLAPHEYTINFFSDPAKPISRIHLNIMEDGTFLVNETRRGKF